MATASPPEEEVESCRLAQSVRFISERLLKPSERCIYSGGLSVVPQVGELTRCVSRDSRQRNGFVCCQSSLTPEHSKCFEEVFQAEQCVLLQHQRPSGGRDSAETPALSRRFHRSSETRVRHCSDDSQ
ncbi:hypothetical protein MHYP_G00026120 [Metynnis hypsauchen]